MTDKELKNVLADAFGDTPAAFHAQMQATAADARARRPFRAPGGALRLAAAALIALSIISAAAAVMEHYGVLNFNPGWQDDYYYTLPEAQNMIQYDLAKVRTGNILWQVQEAVYDGRVLRILYSATDLTETAPFTTEQKSGDGIDDCWNYYNRITRKNGVWLKCDGNGEIFVNGQGVNLGSVDCRYGDAPGEVLFWIDSRMEYYDKASGEYSYITPDGVLKIDMPFSYPDKDENPGGALSFALKTEDAASFYALKLPKPFTLPDGAQVAFTDLHFSPATVFISYNIVYPQGTALPAKDDLYSEGFSDFVYWAQSLINDRDEALGMSKDGYMGIPFLREDGRVTVEFHVEFAPSTRYTHVNYLLIAGVKVPITLDYKTH